MVEKPCCCLCSWFDFLRAIVGKDVKITRGFNMWLQSHENNEPEDTLQLTSLNSNPTL